MKWRAELLVFVSLGVLPIGCSLDQMASHSRLKPYAPTSAFIDGTSARPPVPGTVARGELAEDEELYQGTLKGRVTERFPFAMTRADLERGRSRFEINCSPCHGRTGLGDGMIAARGFSPPPSYLHPRLLQAKVGHLYQVITNGFGAMAAYDAQVSVRDRWRIVAYIRALQFSRRINLNELAPAGRAGVTEEILETNAQSLGKNGRPVQ